MKKVAIVGTQGVPALYGGFESLVENLLKYRSSDDIQYTVYCSSKDQKKGAKEYEGAKLRYIKISSHGGEAILYDMLSLIRSIRGFDTILMLGASGYPLFPIFKLLSKSKLIINKDGIEYKRNRGNLTNIGGKISLWAEKASLKYGDLIISDNKAIQDYVTKKYNKESVLIAYGGDQAIRNVSDKFATETLNKYKLEKNDYAFAVCRIEPENNCHIVLEAFSKTNKKIMFVGNFNRSEYGQELKEKYKDSKNIIISDPIYDLDTLFVLRNNCKMYLHGHSVGGTNPSLVEAMFFGCPILAYDVVYNRETTENKAYYFKDAQDIITLLNENNLDGSAMKEIAQRRYTWRHIVKQYEELY